MVDAASTDARQEGFSVNRIERPATLDRVDDPAAEPLTRRRRVAPLQLAGQLREHGIEAHDELAALPVDRAREAVGEMRHGNGGHTANLRQSPESARGRFRSPSAILGGDVPVAAASAAFDRSLQLAAG